MASSDGDGENSSEDAVDSSSRRRRRLSLPSSDEDDDDLLRGRFVFWSPRQGHAERRPFRGFGRVGRAARHRRLSSVVAGSVSGEEQAENASRIARVTQSASRNPFIRSPCPAPRTSLDHPDPLCGSVAPLPPIACRSVPPPGPRRQAPDREPVDRPGARRPCPLTLAHPGLRHGLPGPRRRRPRCPRPPAARPAVVPLVVRLDRDVMTLPGHCPGHWWQGAMTCTVCTQAASRGAHRHPRR